MSPLLVWEGSGDVPNFCPEGCGGITEDPYGGPCKACWAAVDAREQASGRECCAWCGKAGDLDYGSDGRDFCDEDCADAYAAEWGDD